MSEWITHRPPTEKDAGPGGTVWTTYNGEVVPWSYDGVAEGTPWMPITKPEPYVRRKRWTVRYFDGSRSWLVQDKTSFTYLAQLNNNTDEHREAAERIAAIYEELMP